MRNGTGIWIPLKTSQLGERLISALFGLYYDSQKCSGYLELFGFTRKDIHNSAAASEKKDTFNFLKSLLLKEKSCCI